MFDFIRLFFSKKRNIFASDSRLMSLLKSNRIDKIDFNEVSYIDLLYRNKYNESILFICIQNRFNDLAKFLFEKHPQIIKEVNGEDNDSLINNCINYNNFEIFEYLLKKDINLINFYNSKKEHSLVLCCQNFKFAQFVFNLFLDYSKISDNIKKELVLNFIHYGYNDLFIKNIIKNGFFINSSTEIVCFSLKTFLKELRFSSSEEILNINNFKKDLFIKEEELLLFNKEGYFENRLVIKSFNYVDNFYFYKHNLKNFHKIIGLKNKDCIKIFYKNVLKKSYTFINNLYEVNYGMINCVFFIKNNFNIDENLLKKILIKDIDFSIELNNISKFKELLKNYSNNRIITILSNGFSKIELRDTLFMYDSIKKYCLVNNLDFRIFLLKKPKSIKEIHNFFQIHIHKIGRDNIPINSDLPKKILKLDNASFKDFNIVIPKNNKELILIGQKLAICVGNSFYAFSMSSGSIVIFLLYKNNNIQYCIEYNIKSKTINQAKTYYNIEMDFNLKNDFLKFINYHNF